VKSGINIATKDDTKAKLETGAKESDLFTSEASYSSVVAPVNSAEEEEDEETSSSDSNLTLHLTRGNKNSTPNTRARKWDVVDDKLEERKKRRLLRTDATNKILTMLQNYEEDHKFIIDRMNTFSVKLNKLSGYSSEDIDRAEKKRIGTATF